VAGVMATGGEAVRVGSYFGYFTCSFIPKYQICLGGKFSWPSTLKSGTIIIVAVP
jgi:hypothetical protein